MNKKNNNMKSPLMIIMLVFFVIYALSILFVFFCGLNVSIMSPKDFRNGEIFPTSELRLKNYIDAWNRVKPLSSDTNIFGMTINSLLYAGVSSMFGVLFPAITAYILAKYKFPGRSLLYGYAVVTMMLPIMGAAASSLRFYKALGILDSYLMLPMFASSFGENFIILFASFKGVSNEYSEAAFIDGAGHFTVWLKVNVPQVLSPMFALFLVGFIGKWNDTDTPLLFMRTHPTLASGIYEYSARDGYNIPVLFAAFMMSVVPILALYIAFQKSIMDIQLGGGLKG